MSGRATDLRLWSQEGGKASLQQSKVPGWCALLTEVVAQPDSESRTPLCLKESKLLSVKKASSFLSREET